MGWSKYGIKRCSIILFMPLRCCCSAFSVQAIVALAGYFVLVFSSLAEVCTRWRCSTSAGWEQLRRWEDFAFSVVGPGYFSPHAPNETWTIGYDLCQSLGNKGAESLYCSSAGTIPGRK